VNWAAAQCHVQQQHQAERALPAGPGETMQMDGAATGHGHHGLAAQDTKASTKDDDVRTSTNVGNIWKYWLWKYWLKELKAGKIEELRSPATAEKLKVKMRITAKRPAPRQLRS